MEPIKYSSIDQFRNVVKFVQKYMTDEGKPSPTLTFSGTVKVHGTNCSVIVTPDGEQYPQSKNRILNIGKSDNHGFALWHSTRGLFFSDLVKHLIWTEVVKAEETVVIYGEFVGKDPVSASNLQPKPIQTGVAVSDFPKFMYIFGIKAITENDGERWIQGYSLPNSSDFRIYDSRLIWHRLIVIDFNEPEQIQNKLIEITDKIEELCPVGKALGNDGIGEGVVWECISSEGGRIAFKVKGQKHSSSKVKKTATVDVEKVNSVNEFVEYAVTENRLKQGFDEACGNEADRKKLGMFIKWVSTDVLKEEFDTMAAADLSMRDIGGALSKKAKLWFFDQELLSDS